MKACFNRISIHCDEDVARFIERPCTSLDSEFLALDLSNERRVCQSALSVFCSESVV
jgi:hypothetical protein